MTYWLVRTVGGGGRQGRGCDIDEWQEVMVIRHSSYGYTGVGLV